jgi:hypothetical protein
MMPYRQHLPELDLSLEHDTDRTRDTRGWFLFRGCDELGRYASEAAARQAWKQELDASGWKPTPREVDASEVLRKASVERWARNRGG